MGKSIERGERREKSKSSERREKYKRLWLSQALSSFAKSFSSENECRLHNRGEKRKPYNRREKGKSIERGERREKSKSSERREKYKRLWLSQALSSFAKSFSSENECRLYNRGEKRKPYNRREKSKSSERRKYKRLWLSQALSSSAESFSSENECRFYYSRSNYKQCLEPVARRIGKLLVSSTEIGKGSHGTSVFEGYYENRPVAVKRLLLSHHNVAENEIKHLIASDRHPNIVRYYGQEKDWDFMYLALEKANSSLDVLIQSSSIRLFGTTIKLGSPAIQNDLWNADGHPSLLLRKLMRDVVSGLVHLHELGIIHRDLKPQNVLITENCAQLSDMGISKCLLGNKSSLGYCASGSGTLGWQAPEQLLHERQTRAMDVFSLGCVLFFCITGGRHPFGEEIQRGCNIMNNKMDLSLMESMPEARDLISRLLKRIPQDRPTASEVLRHPFFWSSEKRLSFLRDISDAAQSEAKPNSDFLEKLESKAPLIFEGKWDEKIEPIFMADIAKRCFDCRLVRGLLRVVRNKRAHYNELSEEIKGLVGTVPEGFDNYFTKRFPSLLMESYGVASECCKKDEWFQEYALSTKKKKYAT